MLYRIFGHQEPKDLSSVAISPWVNRFRLLTTADYPAEKLRELASMGFDTTVSKFTSEEAGKNSGAFLNSGLARLKNEGDKYAILLASGYQESMQFIDPLFRNARKAIDGLDIYFAITKDVHGVDEPYIDGQFVDFYSERKRWFPSESLAVVKLDSVYPLDEDLSRKGRLGMSKEGSPLGGIELLLTVMKRQYEGKELFGMMGITTNVNRYNGLVPYEWSMSGEGYDTAHPVEYTLAAEKFERREETIDAAMNELKMTPENYNLMYERTYLVDRLDFGKFELESK